MIDSGTSIFLLNQLLYDAITQQFFLNNPSCSIQNGVNVCQCNQTSTWPNFTFIFKGVEVYISVEDYLYVYSFPDGSKLCNANFGAKSEKYVQ